MRKNMENLAGIDERDSDSPSVSPFEASAAEASAAPTLSTRSAGRVHKPNLHSLDTSQSCPGCTPVVSLSSGSSHATDPVAGASLKGCEKVGPSRHLTSAGGRVTQGHLKPVS